MTTYYVIPTWFSGFGSLMELSFGIIALFAAITSYRIYMFSEECKIRRFSLGFFLIAFSYIVWSLINVMIAREIAISNGIVILEDLTKIWAFGVYTHMALFIAGVSLLAYATINVKNAGIYYLLLGLSLTAIAGSLQKLIMFRIIAVFILSFIAYHYLWEYLQSKNKGTFNVFLAFLLLFLGSATLMFGAQYPMAYVIGHCLELAAYLLLGITLVKTLKAKK